MRELKRQLIGALLVILTMAAVIAAVVNFQQQKKFRLPEDGVTWLDTPAGLTDQSPAQANGSPRATVVAFYVQPDGPAAKAGIKQGDVLRKIRTAPIDSAAEVAHVLVGVGAWQKAEYAIERPDPRPGRNGEPVEINLSVFVAML